MLNWNEVELRHLRYFIGVAEELSFTRASEKLHISQPSLTVQVHNLEDELGVRLLYRAKNQVSLTEEGASFLVDAKRLMVTSLEIVNSVRQFRRRKADRINLGYLAKCNSDLLPTTLQIFNKAHPETLVNLFDKSPQEQLRALELRKIDLGFIGLRPPDSDSRMPHLLWECVARHTVVAVLASTHPLAKQTTIALRDLEKISFVAMSEETHPGSRSWLTSMCQDAGSFTPKIVQDVALESGIMTFVAEGLGVTLARKQNKKRAHPGVVFRSVAPPAQADYWIAWHRENVSAKLFEYIEIVKKEAPAWQ